MGPPSVQGASLDWNVGTRGVLSQGLPVPSHRIPVVPRQASGEPFSPPPHCAPNTPHRLSSAPRPHLLPGSLCARNTSQAEDQLRGLGAAQVPEMRLPGPDLTPAFSVWVLKRERGPTTPCPHTPWLVSGNTEEPHGPRVETNKLRRWVPRHQGFGKAESGGEAPAGPGGHLCEAGVEGTRRPEAPNLC